MKGLKKEHSSKFPLTTSHPHKPSQMNMEWVEDLINNVGCIKSDSYLCFILKLIKTQTGISIYYYHNHQRVFTSYTAYWILLHYYEKRIKKLPDISTNKFCAIVHYKYFLILELIWRNFNLCWKTLSWMRWESQSSNYCQLPHSFPTVWRGPEDHTVSNHPDPDVVSPSFTFFLFSKMQLFL